VNGLDGRHRECMGDHLDRADRRHGQGGQPGRGGQDGRAEPRCWPAAFPSVLAGPATRSMSHAGRSSGLQQARKPSPPIIAHHTSRIIDAQ
jgi:hypothetical protein